MKSGTSLLISLWALVFLASSPLTGEGLSLGLNLYPRYSLPLGERADNYQSGLGGGFNALFALESLPYLSLGVEGGYTRLPVDLTADGLAAETALSLTDWGVGLSAALPVGNRFSLYGRSVISGYGLTVSGEVKGTAVGVKYGLGGGIQFPY